MPVTKGAADVVGQAARTAGSKVKSAIKRLVSDVRPSDRRAIRRTGNRSNGGRRLRHAHFIASRLDRHFINVVDAPPPSAAALRNAGWLVASVDLFRADINDAAVAEAIADALGACGHGKSPLPGLALQRAGDGGVNGRAEAYRFARNAASLKGDGWRRTLNLR